MLEPILIDLEQLLQPSHETPDLEKQSQLFLLQTLLTADKVEKCQVHKKVITEPSKEDGKKNESVHYSIEKVLYGREGKHERYKSESIRKHALESKTKNRIIFSLKKIDENIKQKFATNFPGITFPDAVKLSKSLAFLPTKNREGSAVANKKHYVVVDEQVLGKGEQGKINKVLGVVTIDHDSSISLQQTDDYILKTIKPVAKKPKLATKIQKQEAEKKKRKMLYYALREPYAVDKTDFADSETQWLAHVNKKIPEAVESEITEPQKEFFQVRVDTLARSTKVRHLEKFVSGESVESLLLENKIANCTNKEKLTSLKSLAQDLQKRFHNHNIIHHDLHTNNLLMDKNKNISIVDKGLFREAGEQSVECNCAPGAAPPELILSWRTKSTNTVNKTIDVYSFGVIATQFFYENKFPLQQYYYLNASIPNLSRAEFVQINGSSEPTQAEHYINNFLLSLLKPDPTKRLQDATAIITAIEKLEADLLALEVKPTNLASSAGSELDFSSAQASPLPVSSSPELNTSLLRNSIFSIPPDIFHDQEIGDEQNGGYTTSAAIR